MPYNLQGESISCLYYPDEILAYKTVAVIRNVGLESNPNNQVFTFNESHYKGQLTEMMSEYSSKIVEYNHNPQWNTYYTRESSGIPFPEGWDLDNGYFFSAGYTYDRLLVQTRFEHTLVNDPANRS